MAAYTVAVSLDNPTILSMAPGIGFLSGTLNVTSYSQTRSAITPLTAFFKGWKRVIIGGMSSLGFACIWDTTNDSVKGFAPNGNAAAQTEAAEGVNLGLVLFTAFGLYN